MCKMHNKKRDQTANTATQDIFSLFCILLFCGLACFDAKITIKLF